MVAVGPTAIEVKTGSTKKPLQPIPNANKKEGRKCGYELKFLLTAQHVRKASGDPHIAVASPVALVNCNREHSRQSMPRYTTVPVLLRRAKLKNAGVRLVLHTKFSIVSI
jgi:hypothetical protein